MRYLLFLFVFISSMTLAQNGINYQGAATDSDGAKLANQNISLRTSVLQGGVDGTTSYSETHNTTTDQFGLFNVVIGQGEVVSGVFDSISWGADAHFLKVELDATGGSDYSLVSTTQMMSVPYALHAENAGLDSAMVANMINQALENNVNGIGIGDYFQGGIVAYIFNPDDPGYIEGEIHGIIIHYSSEYLEFGCQDVIVGANYTEIGQGILNTQILLSCPEENTAAKWCNDLIIDGYDDWFLPNRQEVYLINQNAVSALGESDLYTWTSEVSLCEGNYQNCNTCCYQGNFAFRAWVNSSGSYGDVQDRRTSGGSWIYCGNSNINCSGFGGTSRIIAFRQF